MASKVSLTDVRATAKAWVAAATVVVTQVASVLVPDSVPGKLAVSVLGVLGALSLVFKVENKTNELGDL